MLNVFNTANGVQGNYAGIVFVSRSGDATNGVFNVGAVSGSGSNQQALIFQNQTGAVFTERMRITETGLVGIGSTAPLTKLQIDDTPGVYSPSIEPTATLDLFNTANGAAGNFAGISFRSRTGDATAGRFTIGAVAGAGSSQQALIFQNQNGATFVERMRIDIAGNVGIGTTTPGTPLDVNGNVTVRGTVLAFSDVGGVSLNVVENANMLFATNSLERMRILSGGEVGIGTTTPGTVLDVNGDTTIRGSSMFFTNVGGVTLDVVENAAMLFNTNSLERMRILSGGEVGIGTVAPASPLDVVGDINTSGEYLVDGAPLSASGSGTLVSGTLAVVFGKTFTVAPSVVLSYPDAAEPGHVLRAISITTTGFTATSSPGLGSFTFDWQALIKN